MRRLKTGAYPQIRELARTQYHMINGHGGKRVTHKIIEKTRGQGRGPNHRNIGRVGEARRGKRRRREDRQSQRPSPRGRTQNWWDKGETSF